MSYHTIASVKIMQVISNSSSSVIQAGESENVSLYNQQISVERNISNSIGNMPMFSHYRLFSEPLPDLSPLFPNQVIIHNELPVVDPLTTKDAEASITVGRLNVISSSNSSYIHVGNSYTLMGDTRTKSMKHYITDNYCKRKGPSKLS